MKLKLHWQIFIAMIFGYFIATFFGNYSKIFEPLGTIFIRLLKMIIVPLVSTSIILGVSSIGNTKTFTRIGIKTLFYYLSTSLIAIIIGLTLTNIIQPGNGVTLTNVDPYNIDEIRNAINKVKNDTEFRQKITKAGLENARNYHPKKISAMFEEVYRQI